MEQHEAGRKACVTADDRVCGDYVAGKVAIEKKIMRVKKKGDSWRPLALPPKPSRPLSCWMSLQEKVRTNSRQAIKHFLLPKQMVGEGEAIFWTKKVPIEKLMLTKTTMNSKGVMVGRQSISMKDLVAWEDLRLVSWSAGPGKGLLLTSLGWKATQVAIYEICLALYDLDSETHAWVRSDTSLEFVSPTPKKKATRKQGKKKTKEIEIERQEIIEDDNNLNVDMEEQNYDYEDNHDAPELVVVVEPVQPVEPAAPEPVEEAQTPVRRFRFRRRQQPVVEQGGLEQGGLVEAGVELEEQQEQLEEQQEQLEEHEEQLEEQHEELDEQQEEQQEQLEEQQEEQAFHPLVPILQDWLQYGGGETLTSFCHEAKLQLRQLTISDTRILLELHDSSFTIQATLHEDYREDVKYMGQHAILTLDTTTGGPRELVIVKLRMEPGLQLDQGAELSDHLEPLVSSILTLTGNIDRAPLDYQDIDSWLDPALQLLCDLPNGFDDLLVHEQEVRAQFDTEETYKDTLALLYDHENFISDNHYVDEEDKLVVFVRSATSAHITYTVTVAAPRTRGASKVPAIRRFTYTCSCAAKRKTKRKQGKCQKAVVDPTRPLKCKHQGAILIAFFRIRN